MLIMLLQWILSIVQGISGYTPLKDREAFERTLYSFFGHAFEHTLVYRNFSASGGPPGGGSGRPPGAL